MAGRKDFEYYEAEYCYKDYERGVSEAEMEDYYENLSDDEKSEWNYKQLFGRRKRIILYWLHGLMTPE